MTEKRDTSFIVSDDFYWLDAKIEIYITMYIKSLVTLHTDMHANSNTYHRLHCRCLKMTKILAVKFSKTLTEKGTCISSYNTPLPHNMVMIISAIRFILYHIFMHTYTLKAEQQHCTLPLCKSLVRLSVGKSCPPHTDILHQTQVTDLL